jgi:AcrR family transcriptional regulator
VLLNNVVMKARGRRGTLLGRRRARPLRHRDVTRERVLEAAEALFLEKGFRATSVHDVAAAAGYTTGAVYSSFSGKDDLFLAVSERRQALQNAIWLQALESVPSAKDAAAAMGDALSAAMPERSWIAMYFEFLSYAARDAELSRELAERYRAVNETVAEILGGISSSSPLAMERLAPIIAALQHGLALTWLMDPDAADPTLFAEGVAVLIGALPEPDGRPG